MQNAVIAKTQKSALAISKTTNSITLYISSHPEKYHVSN